MYLFNIIYKTTNPHNQFFFIRLCEFTLSPNNLITSILRTSCGHILSPPQKVRRNLRHDYSPLTINAPFLITQMAEVAEWRFYLILRECIFLKKNFSSAGECISLMLWADLLMLSTLIHLCQDLDL